MRAAAQQNQYSEDAWKIVKNGLFQNDADRDASLFSQANGLFGFRADFEELPTKGGAFISGVFESQPIVYGEKAYGYAKNSQTIVAVGDVRAIRIVLDGEPLGCPSCICLENAMQLCFKNGVYHRTTRWKTPSGAVLRLIITRFLQMNEPVGCLRIEIVPETPYKVLELTSIIDQTIPSAQETDDPRVGIQPKNAFVTLAQHCDADGCSLLQRTINAGTTYAAALCEQLDTTLPCKKVVVQDDTEIGTRYVLANNGSERGVILTKYFSYIAHPADNDAALHRAAIEAAASAMRTGFDALLRQTSNDWQAFWQSVGIEIAGNDRILQGLRYNLFQLRSSAEPSGRTSVAAKGLSGSGYEGHYFWDTETFMFPFFLYCAPDIAKALLRYRFSILDHARDRARELGYSQGALFPWRTINGEECSAYYPAGTAQYHINADIANAIGMYVDNTGDVEFLRDCGLEMLIETARFWMQIGFYDDTRGGKFCIRCVTGPDEYNALVDNNCYTNLMTAHNLMLAADALKAIEQLHPTEAAALKKRLNLAPSESAAWQRAAKRVFLPYDEKRDLYLQDEGFPSRKPLNIKEIPPGRFPLLMHYHPLEIYRHRVCKQADLVLALLLRSEAFSAAQKKAAYRYYEPLTTHDSSLSRAIFGIIAGETGNRKEAERFFEDTIRLDLDDMHGNVRDGLHLANMGGAWMGISYGFGGLRLHNGKLSFHPWLPKSMRSLTFSVQFRAHQISVNIERNTATYTLLSGEPLVLYHNGKSVRLTQTKKVNCPIQ